MFVRKFVIPDVMLRKYQEHLEEVIACYEDTGVMWQPMSLAEFIRREAKDMHKHDQFIEELMVEKAIDEWSEERTQELLDG